MKRPCGQLIVVDDGYDLFLTMMLYPSFGVGRARLPPGRGSRRPHVRRDPGGRRRRRGDRALGRRQVAPRSLPRDQPGTGGLERRDVEVYNPGRISTPGGGSMKFAALTSAALALLAGARAGRVRPGPKAAPARAPPRRTPSPPRAAPPPPPSPELDQGADAAARQRARPTSRSSRARQRESATKSRTCTR